MKIRKQVTAAVKSLDDACGSFDLVLSTDALDRDGEEIPADSWAQPLPASIPLNVNHSSDVGDIVGSGRPWIDESGRLRVAGTFASTPEAQRIRALVAEGHLRTVSVEFLRRLGPNGEPVNELVGGAFVTVPSNPEARVLAAKGLEETATGSALLQAIHDASLHLGARCVVDVDDEAAKAAALRLRLKALGS